MNDDALPRLLVITDRHRARHDLLATLDAALAGCPPGVAVVLREHDLPTAARLALGQRLRERTRRCSAALFVADRVDLALALGADGVQLGARSLPAHCVRARWPQLLVGVSCHDEAELRRAAAAGAHYATLSPVFPTASKPGARPLGVDEATALARRAGLPLYALGGIQPDTATLLDPDLFVGVAVIGAVLASEQPAAALRALLPGPSGTVFDVVRGSGRPSETP